jgi:hypothetical protein
MDGIFLNYSMPKHRIRTREMPIFLIPVKVYQIKTNDVPHRIDPECRKYKL